MFKLIICSLLSILMFFSFLASCSQSITNIEKDKLKNEEIVATPIKVVNYDEQIGYDKYIEFIKSQLKLDDDNIFFFTDEFDLDGDGNVEILCRVKNHYIYALRNKDGAISFAGENVYIPAFSNSKGKIVNMRGVNSLFVYITVSNEINMEGFSLLSFKNNELKIIKSSWSESGAGSDYLTSSKNDGIYDGFVQKRFGMEVMYIPMVNNFSWDEETETFKFVETTVDVGDYPEKIPDLINQYISLKCLDNGASEDIAKRLKEINPSEIDCFIDRPEILTSIKNDYLYKEEAKISHDVDYTKNTAWANVSYKEENIFFNLKKAQGRWIIESSQFNQGTANDDLVTLDEAKATLKPLMDKGRIILSYYSNEGLKVDYDSEPKIIDGEKYYKVRDENFKSIEDIKIATERVFTHEYANKTFYEYAFNDSGGYPALYKEVDGVLYEATPGGIGYAIEVILDTMVIKMQTEESLILEVETKLFDEPYENMTIVLKLVNGSWRLDSRFY